MDDTKDYAWHSFDSEADIKAYANRASGEPIVLPELSLTPYESERAVRCVDHTRRCALFVPCLWPYCSP